MSAVIQLVKVHPNDNVAVATQPLVPGTVINTENLTVEEAVPAGHKVALTSVDKGQVIIKYGFEIGEATENIRQGEHVHSHNLKTKLNGTETYSYHPVAASQGPQLPRQQFLVIAEKTEKSAFEMKSGLSILWVALTAQPNVLPTNAAAALPGNVTVLGPLPIRSVAHN